MGTFGTGTVYEKLGVRASINAVGTGTVVGGAGPPDFVREKMEEVSTSFVDMGELLARSGEFVAEIMGTEAAFITSGGAAALTMSAAACMAGTDADKLTQLPNTSGMKDEVLVLKKRFDSYDRCVAATGAKLIEVGDDEACTTEQLEAAIGPNTAAIYYAWPPYGAHPLGMYDWAPPPGDPALPTPEEAHSIGSEHGVPLIVDGASDIYPLDHLRKVAQAGDLVCFGGKYYGGPNASGFVSGRKDLVEAVTAQSFIPTHGGLGIGRSMKSDRQQVVAVVVALDAWFTMDHEARIAEYDRRITAIERAAKGLPGVETDVYWSPDSFYGSFLTITVEAATLGKDAKQIGVEMYEGEPSILLQTPDAETVRIFVYTLTDGEDRMIADRLKAVLTS